MKESKDGKLLDGMKQGNYGQNEKSLACVEWGMIILAALRRMD